MKKSNVRNVALDILLSIEKNQSYSNILLNRMIEKNHLNSKDIGLLTEIVYGTIQRKMTLDYFLRPFTQSKRKIEKWVYILLRMSAYQMVYLDRVPDRAIIFEAVEIAKQRGHKGISSMVNGVLRAFQREGAPSFAEITDPYERLAIETSHPKWLIKRWVDQLGYEATKQMCEVNLMPPVQTVRVNTNKLTKDELLAHLNNEGYDVVQGDLSDDAIKSMKGNLAKTTAFQEGLFTVQDESSMLVAKSLNVKEQNTILDACSAPGGKATHIAELLKNTGRVVSIDLHKHKVKLVQEQIDRLELSNVETNVLDSREVQQYYAQESFDRILVDAPCSGLGVVRRKPDIKYAKTEEDVLKLAEIQMSILKAVAPLLKKDGILVYSTCTIDKAENSDVINKFLLEHEDYEQDLTINERLPENVRPYVQNGQLQLLPHYFKTDGFYIACLRKRV
ncbi:16S rRNA (cytosine(967)-C(5))-methyltransferase RsmB [Bacillus sp. SM2101]|uniref:16S rRNA (cytosine(967)-C(5))-methyltransferase RsmB n=1 Tax=Bacillus sp. SM2101 TaxID=2805366 RepID=UPI001BDECCA4|nr:16S rRNA (cytosine(967)-C(5))-methyltransferase RsmB [Bacillus sp. SM2101]